MRLEVMCEQPEDGGCSMRRVPSHVIRLRDRLAGRGEHGVGILELHAPTPPSAWRTLPPVVLLPREDRWLSRQVGFRAQPGSVAEHVA